MNSSMNKTPYYKSKWISEEICIDVLQNGQTSWKQSIINYQIFLASLDAFVSIFSLPTAPFDVCCVLEFIRRNTVAVFTAFTSESSSISAWSLLDDESSLSWFKGPGSDAADSVWPLMHDSTRKLDIPPSSLCMLSALAGKLSRDCESWEMRRESAASWLVEDRDACWKLVFGGRVICHYFCQYERTKR